MIAAFFSKSGYIAFVPLEDCKKQHSLLVYHTLFARSPFTELSKKIHHSLQDNISLYTALGSMDYLKVKKKWNG